MISTTGARRLCWRLWRGRRRLDLVEEISRDQPPNFVGLVDGAPTVAAPGRREAGMALIQRACLPDAGAQR